MASIKKYFLCRLFEKSVTENGKMYLWQFYHNEYLSISKQHLYLSTVLHSSTTRTHTSLTKWIGKFAANAKQEKKCDWIHLMTTCSMHIFWCRAHTHAADIIYASRLHISIPVNNSSNRAKICFIHFLTRTRSQSVNRFNFHTLQMHTHIRERHA